MWMRCDKDREGAGKKCWARGGSRDQAAGWGWMATVLLWPVLIGGELTGEGLSWMATISLRPFAALLSRNLRPVTKLLTTGQRPGRTGYVVQVPLAGLFFLGLLLLVASLSLTSGNNLIYLLFAILFATGFVSLLSSRLVLQRLVVTLRHPDRMKVGEEVPLELEVENRHWIFPAVSLSFSVMEEGPQGGTEAVELFYCPLLPRRTELQLQVSRRFPRRGVYKWPSVRVATRFPFGFLEHRRGLVLGSDGGGHRLVVFPETRPLVGQRESPLLHLGLTESRIKGRGHDLYLIRPLLDSDDGHPIDWKATARTDQLMVRDCTREEEDRVTILLDLNGEGTEDRYERAISLAASLIIALLTDGVPVRLGIEGVMSGFGSGQSYAATLLEQLAFLPPAGLQAGQRAASRRSSHEALEWLAESARSARSEGEVFLVTAAVALSTAKGPVVEGRWFDLDLFYPASPAQGGEQASATGSPEGGLE
jgi:uncharacterized protein (DUF58 family)